MHSEDREGVLPEASPMNKDKPSEDFNRPFSKKKFKNVIKDLKNKKAEGFDSISNEMIKNAPEEILCILHRFVNLCLEKSLVPHKWCLDLINPIFKDGNLNDPNNYRVICISSALLKIICSLLNFRLQTFCDEQKLISDNQIGFKKDHKTSDHLLT